MLAFEFARALESKGDLRGALKHYEQSSGEHKEGSFRAGLMCERLKNWERAVHFYQRAVGENPQNHEWRFRLGLMLLKSGSSDEAREQYVRGLELSQKRDPAFTTLLRTETKWFLPVLRMLEFFSGRIDQLRERTEKRQKLAQPDPKIFMYWGQGAHVAPPVVKACIRAAQALSNEREFRLIDDAEMPYFADIPRGVLDRIGENRTALSDVLRFALLSKYGGAWLDATCLMARNVLQDNLEFFAFTYRDARISSWFLTDKPGGYISSMMYEALLMYWEKHDRIIDYYILHHIFDALSMVDDDFCAEFMASKRDSARPPHDIQRNMHKSISDFDLKAHLSMCPVHKLTYKFDQSLISSNTVLAEIIRSN